MSTEKARSGETSAKLSPGESGEFCRECGRLWTDSEDADKRIADLESELAEETLKKEALLSEEFNRRATEKVYMAAVAPYIADIEKLESELAQESRLKCVYFAEGQKVKRERDQLAAQVELARKALEHSNVALTDWVNAALAEETRLKCDYYAQWQQAKRDEEHFCAEWQTAVRLKHECWRERDRLAMQLSEKEIELNALQVEAMELRLAKAEPNGGDPRTDHGAALMYIANQNRRVAVLEQQLAQARKQAFLDAMEIVKSEHLEEPTAGEGDQAYDIAIDHAIEAMRREAEKCK